MTTPTISTFGRLATKKGAAAAKQLDYGEFSPGVTGVKTDGNRNRGELDRAVNRTRTSAVMCQPSYSGEPTALEWIDLLDWIMCGTATGSTLITYPYGTGTSEREVWFDDANGKLHRMHNVAVKNATISTSNSERLLSLAMSLSAASLKADGTGSALPAYELNASADVFPTVTLDDTSPPFVLPDASGFTALGVATTGTVTVNSAVMNVSDFSLGIDNGVPDRMFHNFYQTRNIKPDRVTTLSFSYPEGEQQALYTAAEDGIPVFIRMAFGVFVMEIDLPAVIFPRAPMQFQNRGEVVNRLDGVAYKSASAASLTMRLKTA